MKLVNLRNGWHIEGEFIALIKAGDIPTDDQLLAYWHLKPGQLRYADHARRCKYARCVLRKHNSNFIIVPLSVDISEVTV